MLKGAEGKKNRMRCVAVLQAVFQPTALLRIARLSTLVPWAWNHPGQ
jgi:hypothetical protein